MELQNENSKLENLIWIKSINRNEDSKKNYVYKNDINIGIAKMIGE
jgi:hypothetical protein